MISRNLSQRIAAALLLLPPVLALIYAGGIVFTGLLAVAAFFMLTEWNRVTEQAGRTGTVAAILFVFLLTAGIWWIGAGGAAGRPDAVALFLAMAMAGLCMLVWLVPSGPRENGNPVSRPSLRWLVAGGLYVGMAVLAIAWLRTLDSNGELIVWLFFCVWATDVGGYFFGKGIGGPKLAPTISPKKTWAGFFGGVFLAVVAALLFSTLFGWDRSLLFLSGAGVCVSVMAQIGDLFESLIKRRFGAKDSGDLIPGHGGVLDRVDGLVFAAPATAIAIGMQSWAQI